jgi:uncharacterized protein YbjQ (UPF0145 family)
MDNPFSADNKANPFQTPYQQGQTPAAAPGIKPFAAVDLAPPAGHNGQRLNAPGNPTASAFTGGDFGNAFLSPQSPSSQGMPPMPPIAAPQAHTLPTPPAPQAPSNAYAPMAPAQGTNLFAPKPAPQAMPDYTPVPNGIPASARQSTILSMSDFNDVVNMHKPEFFLTTTQQVDGFAIRSFLGVVSVEIVIPKDLLFRNPAPHGEMHRLKAAEDELQRVKNQAFVELGDKAKKLGADGVVGVSLAFSQFDAVVFLCAAVGTAVKLAD